jgi:hypothetical protein
VDIFISLRRWRKSFADDAEFLEKTEEWDTGRLRHARGSADVELANQAVPEATWRRPGAPKKS